MPEEKQVVLRTLSFWSEQVPKDDSPQVSLLLCAVFPPIPDRNRATAVGCFLLPEISRASPQRMSPVPSPLPKESKGDFLTILTFLRVS